MKKVPLTQIVVVIQGVPYIDEQEWSVHETQRKGMVVQDQHQNSRTASILKEYVQVENYHQAKEDDQKTCVGMPVMDPDHETQHEIQ